MGMYSATKLNYNIPTQKLHDFWHMARVQTA
jgi:hypothetical protein